MSSSIENENSGSTPQSVADLVVKYIPIVFFHSHETYFPSSIDYFLANCRDTNASLQFGITSSPQRQSFIVNNPHCQFGFHESKDLDATPLYVSYIEIHPHAFRISYYLFFPHQSECWYCNGYDLSPESGQQQLSPVTELFEIQVTTEGHITNVWINSTPVPLNEMEMYGNRIVLYSSKGVHTLVSQPPTQLWCGDYYITPFVAKTIEVVNKKSQ